MAHKAESGQGGFIDYQVLASRLQGQADRAHDLSDKAERRSDRLGRASTRLFLLGRTAEQELYELSRQQAVYFNEAACSDEMPMDEMMRQAFIIADGLKGVRPKQLGEQRKAVERVLPQLQEPGMDWASFGSNGKIDFGTVEEPAGLVVHDSGNIRVRLPGSDRERKLDPEEMAVGGHDIIGKYKTYQEDLLARATDWRSSAEDAWVVPCARAGRTMAAWLGQFEERPDPELAALIESSQVPIHSYLERTVRDVLAGSYLDSSQLVEVVREVEQSDPEIVEEYFGRVAREVVENPREGGLELLATIIRARSTDRHPSDWTARKIAELEAEAEARQLIVKCLREQQAQTSEPNA